MGHDEQEYRFGRPHRTHRQVHVIINDPSVKELRGEIDRTGKFEKVRNDGKSKGSLVERRKG